MRKIVLLVFIIIIGFTLKGFSSESLLDKVEFASIEKAKELLTQEDDFTNSWSQFDIDSRMHKPNSTKSDLLEYIAKQTREWSKKEKEILNNVFSSIDKKIAKQGFKIDFPNKIYFVKTTTKEEGEAEGYTRANYIVLNNRLISKGETILKKTIVHELFHILTRNNSEFRKEMYGIIGFSLMDDVEFPSSIKDYRITNPDAPQLDSYITIRVDGEAKSCMMILYSKQNYVSGDFFKYINVGFLSLSGNDIKSVEYKNGKPIVYSFRQVSGFFEQVGRNTQYIIHPEEILAENFVFAVLNKSGLPNPEIVDKISKKLMI
jgi:hypothetical protein